MATIYEQLGGAPAMDAAVDIFYRKVLADDRISKFFEGVDMERQAAKQKAFLTMVFGGPNSYTGKDMRNAHARRGCGGKTRRPATRGKTRPRTRSTPQTTNTMSRAWTPPTADRRARSIPSCAPSAVWWSWR